MKHTPATVQESATAAALPGFSVPVPRPPPSARRARPPAAWSLRADLPLVREPQTDAGGNAVKVRTPEDARNACSDLCALAQEAFVVLDLNTRNAVIDKRLVSLGLADASLVHPREVFRGAIANGAAAVVLVHNHPSGDATPSAEDLRITRQLVEAGKIIAIRVLDHVVIGRTPPTPAGFVSLRESGLAAFDV